MKKYTSESMKRGNRCIGPCAIPVGTLPVFYLFGIPYNSFSPIVFLYLFILILDVLCMYKFYKFRKGTVPKKIFLTEFLGLVISISTTLLIALFSVKGYYVNGKVERIEGNNPFLWMLSYLICLGFAFYMARNIKKYVFVEEKDI